MLSPYTLYSKQRQGNIHAFLYLHIKQPEELAEWFKERGEGHTVTDDIG